MKRREWPIWVVCMTCCLLGCGSSGPVDGHGQPLDPPPFSPDDLAMLGPGYTQIDYVVYDRLVIDEPVSLEIGLRGPPATYAVHYEVRDGIREDPADVISLTDSWGSSSGTIHVDKDSYQDQAVNVSIAGPTIPGVRSALY